MFLAEFDFKEINVIILLYKISKKKLLKIRTTDDLQRNLLGARRMARQA